MKKEGIKKPDITAIIENSVSKKIKWFVYDMKDTVINVKVAGKLCSQWHKGIEHISREYLGTKSEYQIENSVGVITRYYNKDKLREDIHRYEQRLNNANSSLAARKSLMKVPVYREMIRFAQNIIEDVYEDYDEISGEKKKYKVQYVELVKETDCLYKADMFIKL